ncbi:MAG: GAF domain-containing sensor histidine kinase [Candidatus Omnitrophica bacterium]|nr:GAF domain-containing sensor histidine kinase [Candidatus Omnitrophota bacterium]
MSLEYLVLFLAVCLTALFAVAALWIYERRKFHETIKSLDYFKKLCDELDQNTKLIVQKDLELSRTQESLDQRARELFVLHELGNKIGSVFDESVLAGVISKVLCEEFNFEKTAFFLRLRDKSRLLCLGSYGIQEKSALQEIAGSVERALTQINGSVLAAADSPEPDLHKMAVDLKFHSFLLVPIVLKEEKVGAILVGNSMTSDKIGEDEKDIMNLLANQVAVVIDNSRLYEQLRQSHHLLESKVQERTRELENLNQRLKHLSDMKSDFVSSASHELRTPLTSIQGYSSILTSGKLGPVTPEQQTRLNKIHLHANELVEMINTLLDISRIERGKTEMKMEQFSLKDLIAKVVDLLQPQFSARKIQVRLDLAENMEPAIGDVPQLQRVFINLLSNAVKYAPDNGTGVINVKVSVLKTEYQVSIGDNGVGIPEEALPKLFTEFYRVDTPMNQEIKGTGLGLSLVKRIIEAHKGSVWAASRLGMGTTFHFTLPRKAS